MTRTSEPMLEKYDPQAIESAWYRRWEEAGLFHVEPDTSKPPFVIAMPPPNVTGRAHMGHGSTYTPMDILTRYHTMRGYNAVWLPGQDHAAIATQNVLERELAKQGMTRFDLGRERFVEYFWRWRVEYGNILYQQFRALGFGPDWQRDRFTLDEGLSRAVVRVFISLYEEGLIYRGTRLVNWCPRCGSTLSDSEVEHEDRPGTLYRVRYAGADGGDGIVIATTRPETIFADVAVAVHPDDDRYKHLIGTTVTRPLSPGPIPVIADPAVEPGFGTGALKITPAHDQTDYEIGERHRLGSPSVIGTDGRLAGPVEPEFAGMDRFEARELAVERLRERGVLVGLDPHETSVGLCYRCDTPIEPLLSLQWFLRMQSLAAAALEASRSGRVRFPQERFGRSYIEWLEKIRDWNISRQLWIGHRLPVWYCSEDHANVGETAPPKCTTCGRLELRQDDDTLDTWFSSALWPFSILGWPDKTKELAAWYPTQVLLTAREILFLWVARMVMMGLHFLGREPFATVFVTPLIMDEQGRKMSKSLGNSLDPMDLVRDFGADATRFGIVSHMHSAQDVRFSVAKCDDARRFCNKLWQAVRFALQRFPELGADQPVLALPAKEALTLADRAVLDGLANVTARVTEALEIFDFSQAAESLYAFVWNTVCDVYIEIAKDKAESRAAVLGHVLRTSLQLLHPLMPFVTEELWQRLSHDREFIGRSAWPDDANAWRDADASAAMMRVLGFVETVLALRAIPKMPYRELSDIHVTEAEPSLAALLQEQHGVLERLARIGRLRFDSPPRSALTRRYGGANVFLPVDNAFVERERVALAKEIEKSETEIAAIERKLASSGFVAKAPPDVVDKERTRLDALRSARTNAAERLAAL
ncbi:MAG TPA: valine--tRNA ligase [Candidatus Eremiobacteraceae bacterium]|nr:valine--tRNA ligase [Candidatus Eremiobacteraceae bacterium]